MRKDSVVFLRKLLEYRQKVKEDSFLINYQYFKEIPSVENAILDILDDLINNNCITSNSQVTDLEGNININLTLDGITYFEDSENKRKDRSIILNVSGGQVNLANDNGKINAAINDKINEHDTLMRTDHVVNKEKNSSSSSMASKVFVSYSWTPDCNKKWVEQLVHRLEADGVQVVIDFKDLKLGHDKYAFMERTVSDETIKKVLIICNRTYKEKADGRVGGVGDESAIITSHIYGNVRQEKFIPVVNEYDENGKPFLPNYLASRMYADLTDFEIGYKQLLNSIEEVDAMDKSTTGKVENDDIKMFREPTPFFAHRIGKAFPGVRGKREFTDPKECVDRLEILLKHPLNKSTQGMTDPIWWFRGGSNLDIETFTRITPTKFLMNSDEIEVKRVVVYVSRHYFRSFVYVEAFPEESIGIYGKVDQQYVDEMVKTYGEHHEEYAVYEGHAITRAEFDDGAAEIDGKIVDITGKAKLRVRYLTPYNFIICAKWNPLNENQYDDRVEDILNGILKGIRTIDELTALVEKIPRHKRDI